jgi:drug/metabolite transporter (DMT)-like permease
VNASPATTGLGLLSATSWGGSDFAGGYGARKAPAILITAAGQIVSFAVLVALNIAAHAGVPGRHDLILTVIAGFEGALCLAIFYRALALGSMGLTAALTGLLTALVPVVFSAIHYGLPGPVTAVGLLAGCVAIWLITHQHGPAAPTRALLYGAIAGIGFGTQLVLFKLAASTGFLSMMTVVRAAGVTALLLVLAIVRPSARVGTYWIAGTVSGMLDTAGNIFYLAASRLGRLDTAAVICSLYPAVTFLLAVIFLRERPSRRQLTGMVFALAAVALLSL